MPLYDYRCKDDHLFEAYQLPDAEVIQCRFCKKKAVRVFVSAQTFRRQATSFKPIVVFKDKNGKYKFPGNGDAPTPCGCERVEMKNVSEVRKFEKEISQQDYARWENRQQREEQQYSHAQSEMRSMLRERMKNFSPRGRDFANAAFDFNNNRPRQKFESGFTVDVMSFDKSNMDSRHRE